jgi:hypothetical protein
MSPAGGTSENIISWKYGASVFYIAAHHFRHHKMVKMVMITAFDHGGNYALEYRKTKRRESSDTLPFYCKRCLSYLTWRQSFTFTLVD